MVNVYGCCYKLDDKTSPNRSKHAVFELELFKGGRYGRRIFSPSLSLAKNGLDRRGAIIQASCGRHIDGMIFVNNFLVALK